MFLVSVSQDTFRAEHFIIVSTVELNFFVPMNVTSCHRVVFGATSCCCRVLHGEGCQDGIVHR
jgi:hypothetical protein